jgi:hypothetical protein
MDHRSDRMRMPTRQADLFDTSLWPAGGILPSWGSLPLQTRHTLTGLVARLLLDHAGDGRDPRSDADER